jgi:hypothetical protein
VRTSKKMAFVCAAAALASSGAQAVENGLFPTNLGPEGMQHLNIPPPGLYAVNYTNYFHASQVNDKDGNKIKGLNADINVVANATRLLSYYDISRFDDSRVGIQSDMAIPFGYVDSSVGGDSTHQFGLADIFVNPFSVYWKKGDWLNVGFSPTFSSLPTGRWQQREPVNLGRNYFSWQPTVAYTFILGGKLDISGRARYIHNFRNNDGAISAVNPTGANYESGNLLAWDFAVGYSFTDKLELAVNGYYLKQISDDEIHGDNASNTVLQEVLDGNRTNLFALGPAIGYDLGPVRVYGQWQHQFEAENTAQGDSFWLRLATRLLPFGGD